MQVTDTPPAFLIEYVGGVMLHIMVTGEQLVGTFSGEDDSHIFCCQLAGKVAGDGAAYQRWVVALQFSDNYRQCLVVFIFGKYEFMVC